MSLAYILRKVESSAGIGSAEENSAQRLWLLDIINEAADEIYQEKDLPLALKETYVRITNGNRVALPPYIGEVRAMRSTRWDNKWRLSDIRARYHNKDWPEMWDKFRMVSIDPIATEITNTAPGTIEVAEADATLIVSVRGETDDSNNMADTVTMDETEKEWTSSFNNIKSITKNLITRQNVVVSDADGTEIAILYADQYESRYMVADVSDYPGIQDCDDGTFAMEVLYKPRLPYLYFDDDTFPIPDFDDIVVLRTKQLLAEEKPGEEMRAALMFKKSERKITKLTENRVGTVDKKFIIGGNQYQKTFRKFYHRYGGGYYRSC
jgi:hypothetical protein